MSENRGLITASQRVVDWLKFLLVLLIITEVILTCVNIVGSFDFPWQLNEGNYLLDHGHPTRTLLNAYGEISPDFQNEYILYELLIAGINRALGWTGLCLFFGLLCLSIYIPCLIAFFRSRFRFSIIDVFFFMLAQFIINMRLSTRPELVADVCYVMVGIMLMSQPGRIWTGRQILTLGLLFCLWGNAHGTFLLGIAMLGLWYVQLFLFEWRDLLSIRDFRWMLPGLAAVIGCAINPFGLYRLIQPFQLHGLLWGQGTSLEMGPVTSGGALLLLTWTGAALLALLVRIRERKYYWMLAMLLLLHYLALGSIRYTLFIGLSLLVVAWDGLANPREKPAPPFFPLAFVTARFCFYLVLVLGFINLVGSLVDSKSTMLSDYCRNVYPKSRVAASSSFSWMRDHPAQNYNILSYHSEGSLAQLPEVRGIHPLIDSGTHRYSDRTNQFYYYAFYSPKTFQRVLAQLHIDAVAINNFNMYWAEALNKDTHWRLVQIADDSQLYLKKDTQDSSIDPHLFSKWDKEQSAQTKPADVSSNTVLRGLSLRPDADSLKMLVGSTDVTWAQDPQISYLKDWVSSVPDNLVAEALQQLQGKSDNSSMGLQVLFSLRLNHCKEAGKIARKWQPRLLGMGYQDLQMLRTEAFISSGDLTSARAILDSFWPKPRYSLRWARLCEIVYADDPRAMPKNSQLLTEMADQVQWQDEIIATLNQNILRLSTK
jgi:hypothetical protein